MADANATIEALEHTLARAWIGRDAKQVRKLLSSRFRLVVGSTSPILLDSKSLADAVAERWRVSSMRFGTNVYVRAVDGLAIFAAEAEMKGEIDRVDASGSWWLTDVWRKSGLTRRWQLLDRQLSRPEAASAFPQAVKGLQLWR